MRWSVAFVLAIFALASVKMADAGISPQLVVSGTSSALAARGNTTIDLSTPDGTTGALTIFAPPGYTAQLDRPPGMPVGEVLSAVAQVEGDDVELAGSLTAADPATALDSSCATGSHTAVWMLALSGPGLAVSVPVVLDPVVIGPESVYASYRLDVCLGQLRLRALAVRLEGIFGNPGGAGEYTWRARLSAGSPQPEIELRSTALLPVTMSMTGRYESSTHGALLKGTLTAGGRPVVDASVAVSSGNGVRTQTVTDTRGRFAVERPIRAATTFRASAFVAALDVTATGCADPIAPGGCVSAVVSPFSAESSAVRVALPVAPVLRLGSRGASVRRLQERLISLRYLPWGATTGVFDERTWHAVVAFQGWQQQGRDGVVAARTWTALERAGVPTAPGDFRRGLVVDTSRQVLLLVADGRVQRAIHVSTAAPGHWTPRGLFRVYRKEILSWSVPFRAWMPYANYFSGGFAIHGFAIVPSYPASHGCIRVPMAEATVVYSFAGYGTPVLVR